MHVYMSGCSLGRLLVATTSDGVVAALIGDDAAVLRSDLHSRFPGTVMVDAEPHDTNGHVRAVVALIEQPTTAAPPPLDLRGTEFQRAVWLALQRVPVGRTTTYADLAIAVGLSSSSSRAVALACAANPIAVAIPCHRVVRSDGDLSGYRWGIDRKRTLLEREGARAAQPSLF
jgi:AraC family transcriptional regulator, regulatory protein of adaptative response / methylated-DNA-[protein]-cysteine methyltransferase